MFPVTDRMPSSRTGKRLRGDINRSHRPIRTRQIQPKCDDQRQHGRREGLEGKDDVGVTGEEGLIDVHDYTAEVVFVAWDLLRRI